MMRKILTIIVLLIAVAVPDMAVARKCGGCGGSGKVYLPGMSTYGVSNKKKKCTRCGQIIMAGDSHWCKCTTCGGTGHVGSPGRDDRDDPGVNQMDMDAKTYLTTEEYRSYLYLQEQLMQPVKEFTKCHACKGTKVCPTCKGASSFDYPCVACGGGHLCLACRGSGYGETVTRPKTDAERAPILKGIKEYHKLIQQRKQKRNGR